MAIVVRVPKEMVEAKPPHGSPCNRCGLCCSIRPCELGRKVFNQDWGVCPALTKDEDGKWICGLVISSLLSGRMDLCLSAAYLNRIGQGCDSRIESEPINQEFEDRLNKADELSRDAIVKSREIWELPPL